MRVGMHMRVRGGFTAAVVQAKSLGANAMQIFSSNSRTYRTSAIDPAAYADFAKLRAAADLNPCVIHTSYLVNLASTDPKILEGSIRLVRHDLQAASAGEIAYVNTHLGSYGDRDRNEGTVAICRALEAILDAIPAGVNLVMENSAGAGALAGGTLPELGAFIRSVDHPQLGVCLDTAHAWAAGYRINSAAGVDAFLDEAEREIGLQRIHLFHFNDTQVPLAAARDRHWHIGEGEIGFDGFRALTARPELREKTAILETPGDDADDVRNMNAIRAILAGASRTA